MLWVGIALVLCITVFVLLTAIDIYLDERDKVNKSPKEEMFWCQKHGFFRKKHCLHLFPQLGDQIQNAYVCPICYKEAAFDNPDRKLKYGSN